MITEADILIVGAGAAGLSAAIFAGREASRRYRIIILDGAKKLGAKILVSGGGRCNVTNAAVSATDYFGGPAPLIRNVLKAFDVPRTLEWMHDIGVELKLEPTGKYFPVSNSARTVLDALLRSAGDAGAELVMESRVISIIPQQSGFLVNCANGQLYQTRKLIIATGGLALPKSGSDGAGLDWMQKLGHSVIQTTPALAPLLLAKNETPGGHFAELSGVTMSATLRLLNASGRCIAQETGSTLFTHFGLSGPAPMNLSRCVSRYRLETGGQNCTVTLGHPDFPDLESAIKWIEEAIRAEPKRQVSNLLTQLFPERYAKILSSGYHRAVDLSREQKIRLATSIYGEKMPVIGDRGYSFAECTAGGVDLREVDIRTMQSRIVPGLFLCGEILDVDGRIGGFNFHWAWATGYLAGLGSVRSLSEDRQ